MMDVSPDHKLILEELRANQDRLDRCKLHHFPTWPALHEIPTRLGLKVSCSNCGGVIDALHAAAYTRGYVAAGGDGNDIIPGWSR